MMGSVCAEQHKHQLFLSKKALREVDIPPRKLLARRSTASPEDVFADSPGAVAAEEALLQKFLPCNGGNEEEDDEDDPYSSDHFRMYEFKVRRCTRSRSHDWTDCPFAHPGEKARRRDPRRYHYSGAVCPEFRRGSCSRGDNCEFAHGVFECWLHPARYRTEACKDGKNCKRKVCFFSHSPRQLRLLPPSSQTHCNSPPAERKYRNPNHCCLFCHSAAASPTSTLLSMSHLSPPMSPALSPPLSPEAKSRSMSGISPISRCSDRWASVGSCGLSQLNPDSLTYKAVLTELMTSFESMNVNEANSPQSNANRRNPQWVDVSFNNGDDHQQFVLSPSPPTPTPSVSRNFQSPGEFSGKSLKMDDNNNLGCPDFGWVNDLLT